jgi:sugar lactone lactonase YvrE
VVLEPSPFFEELSPSCVLSSPLLGTMESLTAERQEMVATLMAVAGIEDVDFAREFLQDNGWQLETSVNAYMMIMGSLLPERQEMVSTLMAVAGIEDVDFAREFLQDNGWQLETSVNAYMMMIGQEEAGGGRGAGMSSSQRVRPTVTRPLNSSSSRPTSSMVVEAGMSSSPPESPRVRPTATRPLSSSSSRPLLKTVFSEPSSIHGSSWWVRKCHAAGLATSMEVLAGSGSAGFADGAGAASQFRAPRGPAVDGEGNIIIADMGNHRVRKISPDGTVSTLAGSGRAGFADGAGAAAQFNQPYGAAVDGEGNIIIADMGNHRVRKLTRDGTVSTLAGSGSAGFADGAGAAAQFKNPRGAAVDGEGNIIIADRFNHRVRKITRDGTVSTLAGSGSAGFADGAGAAAQFNEPWGVAVDGEGSIIIADTHNHRVRKLTRDGTVSTLAGSGSAGFADEWGGFADGAGAAAQFDYPIGVAVDGEGSIIVVDNNNKRVRKITPDGTVSTLFLGLPWSCGFRGVAIDVDGCVVVSTEKDTVAKIAGCSVAAPGAAEQKRRLAFCMLSHERLGHGSIWAGLEQGLLKMVLCESWVSDDLQPYTVLPPMSVDMNVDDTQTCELM